MKTVVYLMDDFTEDSYINNEKFIGIIMNKKGYTKEQAKNQLRATWNTLEKHRKPSPVKSNDHAPCVECGSVEFSRTGTCFVCVTCGSSQGCS